MNGATPIFVEPDKYDNIDAEKIEVSEDEVEEELKVMAAQYNMTADKVKELIGAENLTFLKKDIQVKKAIDFIFDNAVIK